MLGEMFEINSPQMANIESKLNPPPWLEKILKLIRLKWLKLNLNPLQWREILLKLSLSQMAKLNLNPPPPWLIK